MIVRHCDTVTLCKLNFYMKTVCVLKWACATQISLTVVRIWLHSEMQHSCSDQSLCAALPLPASEPSSLAPERLLEP